MDVDVTTNTKWPHHFDFDNPQYGGNVNNFFAFITKRSDIVEW
jgi:hypothetical protein